MIVEIKFISPNVQNIVLVELKKVVLLVFILVFLSTRLTVKSTRPVLLYPAGTELLLEGDLPVHNIDSGKNFSTIQGAINDNETQAGHTILVEARTYYEHVIVNKSVSLVGEGRDITFIDGNSTGIVVAIEADAVGIYNFTVRNGGLHFTGVGIAFYEGKNCLIKRNILTNNFAGICLSSSDNNNTIDQNLITNNWYGIRLLLSSNNTVNENTITNNHRGFSLTYSSGNILRDNSMASNVYNFDVNGDELFHFVNDVDTSNTVDGKTVYYFINEKDLTINPSTFPDVGYVACVNSTCITIQNLNLTNNGDGILFAYTNNSMIKDVNTMNNWYGIYLLASTGNTLSGNEAIENVYGIELDSSENNLFIGNTVTNNSDGVFLWRADNNTFIRNNVMNSNYRGIYLSASSNNVIFHNNFINNTNQVVVSEGVIISANTWDNGYLSGGNYWSNSTEVDSNRDGIGDTAHVIDANNTDYYPLMGLFHSSNTSLGYDVNVISNSTVEDFQYFESNSTIRMYVSNSSVTPSFGFCRVCIPHTLMDVSNISVTIDNGATPILYHNYTLCDNGTHRWIYFTYEHSTRKVEITPEFPTWISMLLILIMLTVSIVIYKRRLLKTPIH